MKVAGLWLALVGFFTAAESALCERERFEERNGLISIEAEDYHRQNRQGVFRHWFPQPEVNRTPPPDLDPLHSGASGGRYLEILPDTRVTHDDTLVEGENFFASGSQAPRLEYDILINNPGRYYVWARAYPTGTEDNSIHVGFNGSWPESGQALQWCGGSGWYWSSNRRLVTNSCGERNGTYLDLPAGRNTLIFSMREDGFELDKLVLTRDSNYTPSALGPAESLRVNLCNDGQDNNGDGVVDCQNPQCQLYNFCRLPLRGRIAISSDGNGPDPDDIGASAAMFALLDAQSMKDRLVHKDYGNALLAAEVPAIWTEMKRTVSEGIPKFALNSAVFFNAQTQLGAAIDNLANEINTSSVSNPLTVVLAGSPELLYRAVVKAAADRRAYVIVVSHSWWNDYYGITASDFQQGKTKDDIVALGVQWIQIRDQNAELLLWDPAPWHFLRDSQSDKLRWVWNRIDASSRISQPKYDISDAGMLYFALTGDQGVTPAKLRTLLESSASRPAPPAQLVVR